MFNVMKKSQMKIMFGPKLYFINSFYWSLLIQCFSLPVTWLIMCSISMHLEWYQCFTHSDNFSFRRMLLMTHGKKHLYQENLTWVIIWV